MKKLELFGERLRLERIARDYRQSDLASLAGVSTDAISSLENGRPVTTQTLVRVLTALGYEDAFENLLPAPVPSPLDLQKLEGKQRQRVR